MKLLRSVAALALLAGPVSADEARDAFVDANVISIFYHELGHAMIDILELPIFGQEEDAADAASILMIDMLWEEDYAIELAYGAADGFYAEALAAEGEDIAYWGSHGPDEQRFYNTVCLFYGGNPGSRDDFAADMGLPEDRAETCEEEYDLAASSWGGAFDQLAEGGPYKMRFEPEAEGRVVDLLQQEVADLNENFSWPADLLVTVGVCGEANAFYYPGLREVRFCTEFVDHLESLYDSAG